MSDKVNLTGGHIKTKDTQPIEFCKATSIIITNKSNETISYTFGAAKFELEQGENDPWESPHNPMSGRIEFIIPPVVTSVNIKVKIIEIL